MEYFNNYVNLEKIVECFNLYVLPTIESESKSPEYIKRRVIKICDKLGMSFINKKDDLILSFEVYQKIEEIFKNRKEYFNGSIKLYSTKEVEQLLNISNGHVSRLIRRKKLITASIINGQSYFYKDDVDSILFLLDSTYDVDQIEEIIRDKSLYPELGRHNIKNYIKKMDYIDCPIINGMQRIKKEELSRFLDYIDSNYKPRKKVENFLKIFLTHTRQKELKFVNEKELINYVKYNFFEEMYLVKFSKKVPERIINQAIKICKKLDIDWFTNESYTEILIRVQDVEKYKAYFGEQEEKFDISDYYTNNEVKNMFNIVNTDRIAEYSGSISIRNRVYIKKEKVDELYYIKNNTISLNDMVNDFRIEKGRLLRLIDELGVKHIKRNEIPLFNCMLIYNSEIHKIRDYLNEEQLIIGAKDRHEIFKIKTKVVVWDSYLPKTKESFEKFLISRLNNNEQKFLLQSMVYIYAEVLCHLNKEIMDYDGDSLLGILNNIPNEMTKREFAFFLNFCRKKYKTRYLSEFNVDLNANTREEEPYTIEQWRKFGYLLFDRGNEIFNTYLEKALNDRTSAMTWLYCAMHYVCAFRSADIMELPLPYIDNIFRMGEEDIIKLIRKNLFTEEMGQMVVNDVMKKIHAYGKGPSKNRRSKKQLLKLVVEGRYVYTIGLLLTLCEVHRRIAQIKYPHLNTEFLITERATKKEVHKKFFGNEYEDIFKQDYFANIRAVKSNLSFCQIISQEKGWGVGYHLASILRSHSSNKKGVANSTQIYLEYINKDNDVDKITNAIVDRGVFGFVPYQLLKILKGEDIRGLDIVEQNGIIKNLIPLNAYKIEKTIKGVPNALERARNTINDLLITKKEDIKDVLTKIWQGEIPSKMEYSHCLLKAIDRSKCIYPSRTNCIGCDYLIIEMYFLLEFNNMIFSLLDKISQSSLEFDKKRYTSTLINAYLPILQEAMYFLGKEKVRTFIDISQIEENINMLNKEGKLLLG